MSERRWRMEVAVLREETLTLFVIYVCIRVLRKTPSRCVSTYTS